MFDLQAPPAPTQDPPVATLAAPAWDLTLGLIAATVQLDQPNADGTRRVGTGFLINAPRSDGQPRTVLVTAAHVISGMPGKDARIGRIEDATDIVLGKLGTIIQATDTGTEFRNRPATVGQSAPPRR